MLCPIKLASEMLDLKPGMLEVHVRAGDGNSGNGSAVIGQKIGL